MFSAGIYFFVSYCYCCRLEQICLLKASSTFSGYVTQFNQIYCPYLQTLSFPGKKIINNSMQVETVSLLEVPKGGQCHAAEEFPFL